MGLAGDLGLSDDSRINLEHTLLLSASKPLTDQACKTLASITQTSRDTSKMIQIVGYATAAYLIMAGASKLLDSYQRKKK